MVSDKANKLRAEWFWTDRWMGSSGFLLPMEARGVYREMLTQAWLRGARLPNDPEAIQRAIGSTAEEWNRAWPKLQRFWRVDGDYIINDTQLVVYNEALASAERATLRGRKGAQARAQARLKQVPKHKPPSPSLSLSLSLKQTHETDPAPAAPRDGVPWSNDAIDFYRLRFPGATGFKDELLGLLKPLVKLHGWRSPRGGGVRDDFRAYCLDRSIKNRMFSVAAFVKRYVGPRAPAEHKADEILIATSTPEAEQAWARLLVQLEAKLQPWPFATYFRPTYGVSLQPDKLLIVATPLEQTRQTIQKNYGQLVSEVARSAGFVAVKFVVGRRAFGGV